RDDRCGTGARGLCRSRRHAAARDPLSFALRTRIFDLSGAGARCGEAAPFRLTRMIAVTLSLLTAAMSAPKNASAPTPIADLRAWWDSSIAWVNSHWLQ